MTETLNTGGAWRWNPLFAVGLMLALPGCKQAAAEARFAEDYNCPTATSENVSGGTYHVEGCGVEATYTCVNESPGWGNNNNYVNVVCIKEAATESAHAEPPAPPPVTRKGVVARVVDDATGARGVTADLPLSQAGTAGPLLRLKTKPGENPERVWVVVSGSSRQVSDGCDAFTLVVNGAALPAPAPARNSKGGVETLVAVFAASKLAPLLQPNPTLGVRVCDASFDLPDEELKTLRKYLAIRQELAQSAAVPSPAAAAPAAPAPAAPAPAAPAPAASPSAAPAPAAPPSAAPAAAAPPSAAPAPSTASRAAFQ